jgi:anti-sigma factor RsiW
MSDQHISEAEVQAFLRGQLAPERVLAVGRHLSECRECAAAGAGPIEPRLLDDDDLHLNAEGELFPYVDGTVDAIARERIEEHLASCATCRADADDLQRAAASIPRPRSRRLWAYAVGAAAAIVVALIVAPRLREGQRLPHSAPLVVTITTATVDTREHAWHELVDDALRDGIRMPPVLRELAPSGVVLRGAEATRMQLSPRGTVVEETQPSFTWRAVPDARYRVTIFDDGREVAASPALTATRWQPERALARGRMYAWQLQVITPKQRELFPGAAEGPATVRVLDDTAAAELQEARRRAGSDHLLLGVLAARAGLVARAESELSLAAQTEPRASALLDTVRGWRSAP